MSTYYAVKEGRSCGIFLSWRECEKQVKGYSGSKCKAFDNIEDAVAYMNGNATQNTNITSTKDTAYNTYVDYNKKSDDEKCVIVYVDGSYNNTTNQYGYGVLIDYDGEKQVLFGNGICKEGGRNVEGEVAGAMAALETIAKSDMNKSVVIYYDYEGIGSWADGRWRTNKGYTHQYAWYVSKCRSDGMLITLRHVKGHTGNKGNEYVDKIAKISCGLSISKADCEMLSKIKNIPGMPTIPNISNAEIAPY